MATDTVTIWRLWELLSYVQHERGRAEEGGGEGASQALLYRSDFSASSASVSASYQAAAIERNCTD